MRKTLLTKLMLLMAVVLMGAGTAWAEETSTLTFTAICGGSGTADDGAAWTVTSDGEESNFDSTKGIHYGTNSKAVQYIKLSTSDIDGTITKVVVNASTASGVSATVGVTVGGDAFGGEAQSLTTSAADYTFTGSAEGEIIVTVTKPSSAAKAIYVKSVAVTYTAGGGDLEDSDFALTDAPVALTFDLYNNSTAQTISYNTFSSGEVTVDGQGYVSASVDEENQTITVTPLAKTNGEVEITVSQAADEDYKAGSATFTVTIDDTTPIPTHTVTFSVNGTTTTQDFEEGAAITFPANPANVEDKTFVGWVTEEITGTTDEEPEFVTAATMGTEAMTFYAVFADKTPGTQTTVTDVLTSEITGGNSSYSDWSGKTVTSVAVYAGNSAVASGSDVVNKGAIQLRTNNSNSGIISTTSGGTLKSVTVTWTGDQSRTLDIYGSNTAYANASDLYDSNKQGTKLGSIVKNTSTSLTVTGNYAYVGIRSNNQALYLDNISIEWTTGTPDTYSAYCTTVVAAAVEKPVITVAENPFFFSTTATITCATEGASIKYSFDGETWNDYSEALTITETKTIYAKAIKGNDESTVAQVTATKTLATPTVTINATGITNTNVYEGTAAGSLSATITYSDEAIEGANVTWSGNNDEVATIDPSTGAVTLVAAGEVTFTATYAGDETNYKGNSATYTLTVTNSDPNANDGSAEKPYTVAETIAYINTLSGTSANEVYVSGIISQVDSYNSSYSSITYWISDDGTTTGQMEVYSGKGLNGADFSSKDDLQVGDIVTVKGYVKMYTSGNNSTPEFDKNNQLVSFQRPVVTTPSITLSENSIEATAAETYGTITVTYNNLTDVVAEVQFFAEDGTTSANYDWITADINSDNNVEYLIDTNDGAARTAYMKVYAVGNEGEATSDLITITQAAPVTGNQYALFTGDLVEGDYIIYYNGNAMNTTVTSDRLQYAEVTPTDDVITTDDAAIVWHIAKSGDYWTIYNADADAYAAGTGAKNKAQMLEDGTDDKALWTVSGDETYEFVNKANADNEVNSNLRNNGTYGFACYATSTGGALSLYKKVEESVTITAAGYATYCSENALDFSAVEGLTAYTATIANNQVNFTKVEKVPAREGVLLKGADGTYAIPVIASATAIENDFEGVLVDTEKEAGIYVLMNGGAGVGFYQTKGAFTVGANTAYLPALAGPARSFIGLDDVTSVKGITAETMQNAAVYNLQGQRVESSIFNVQSSMLKKGLYIVNGKKVIK